MIRIEEHLSLKPYNTFGMDVKAKKFARFDSLDQLQELCAVQEDLLILGGGSNILFTKDVDALVLKNNIGGIECIKEEGEFVHVQSGAGVVWQDLVKYCIDHNWGGLENLSLIPGNVGASPMQNIGAYGVEIKDVFESLEAYHIREKKLVRFGLADCCFGYRESVFKRKWKRQFVIVNVTFKLRKQPVFNISYGAIQQELERMGVHDLSVQAVSAAVIRIRKSKLPDPAEIGSAGSFFKNPTIPVELFKSLKQDFPQLPGYEQPSGEMKVAAGWLIEQCGWKGFRKGDAGCYEKQALVLVNYGTATGLEIYSLSQDILQSVLEKFNIHLEPEVNIF